MGKSPYQPNKEIRIIIITSIFVVATAAAFIIIIIIIRYPAELLLKKRSRDDHLQSECNEHNKSDIL